MLAVGDAAFQVKCLEFVRELRRAARTIVLVTHDLAAMDRLCDRAMLLQMGQIVVTGSPRKVIDEYVTMGFAPQAPLIPGSSLAKPSECCGILFRSGDSSASIRTSYPMVAQLPYRTSQRRANVTFKISIYWPSGYLCTELATTSLNSHLDVPVGSGMVEFHCPVLALQLGLYRVDISLESNGQDIDRLASARHFQTRRTMRAGEDRGGLFWVIPV